MLMSRYIGCHGQIDVGRDAAKRRLLGNRQASHGFYPLQEEVFMKEWIGQQFEVPVTVLRRGLNGWHGARCRF